MAKAQELRVRQGVARPPQYSSSRGLASSARGKSSQEERSWRAGTLLLSLW